MDHDYAAAGVDAKGNPLPPPVVSEGSSGGWRAEQMVTGFAYLGTIPGLIKIVLDVLTWIAFICVCAGSAYPYYYFYGYSNSAVVFMKFVTCTLAIITMVHVNLYTVTLVRKIDIIWPKWELPYFVISALLLLISSSIIAANPATYYSPGLKASATFGFFSMFGFIGGALVAAYEWKKGALTKTINQIFSEYNSSSAAPQPATITTGYPPYQPPDAPPPTYDQAYTQPK